MWGTMVELPKMHARRRPEWNLLQLVLREHRGRQAAGAGPVELAAGGDRDGVHAIAVAGWPAERDLLDGIASGSCPPVDRSHHGDVVRGSERGSVEALFGSGFADGHFG